MKDIKFTAQFDIRPRVGERRPFLGAKVFAKSNTDSIIDAAFDKSGAQHVAFKSKAWSRLSSKGAKLVASAIRTHYGLPAADVSIAFSHHCGCSMCPCSPGYNVRARNEMGAELLRDKGLFNVNAYAEFEFANEVLDTLHEACEAYSGEFEQEKAAHAQ